VGWVFGVLAVTLGIVLLWGAVSPRSQWRALSAWSVADEHAHEPGGAAYGWRRLLSAVGLLSVVAIGAVAAFSGYTPPAQPRPVNHVEQMWGAPEPAVVDRNITPIATPPVGLVEVPIAGYQAFNDEDGLPDYLDGLKSYEYLGKLEVPGYVGAIPDVGFSGVDFADLVVHVRGPILCIPRQVVVVESETDVAIAVYYGRPDAADGAAQDNVAGCPLDSPVTGSVLIPLDLQSPVGDRLVRGLDGTEFDSVPLSQ